MKNSHALACSIVAIAGAALAQEASAREPVSYDFLTYGVVIATSLVGGALTNLRQFLDDDTRTHRGVRLAYDLLAAVFTGILTFWVCQSIDLDLLKTNVMVGLNAFLGVGSIKVIGAIINKGRI